MIDTLLTIIIIIGLIICSIILISVFVIQIVDLLTNITPLYEGVIVEKKYREKHTILLPRVVGKTVIPFIQNVPESYQFKVSGVRNGKQITQWWDVTEEQYNRFDIGDEIAHVNI